MKVKRAELQTQIEAQEKEKNSLQREIEKMSCKLTQLNDSLAKRIAIRNELDRTIADSELAYIKVTKVLLNKSMINHVANILYFLKIYLFYHRF